MLLQLSFTQTHEITATAEKPNKKNQKNEIPLDCFVVFRLLLLFLSTQKENLRKKQKQFFN
jgi:hypothetical protein